MAQVKIHGNKLASEADRNPQHGDTAREVIKEVSNKVFLQVGNLEQDGLGKKTSSKFKRVCCEKCSLEMNESSLSRHMMKQHPEP